MCDYIITFNNNTYIILHLHLFLNYTLNFNSFFIHSSSFLPLSFISSLSIQFFWLNSKSTYFKNHFSSILDLIPHPLVYQSFVSLLMIVSMIDTISISSKFTKPSCLSIIVWVAEIRVSLVVNLNCGLICSANGLLSLESSWSF